MNFTKLLFGDKYIFTNKVIEKMKKFGVTETTVKRIISDYDRKEKLKGNVNAYRKRYGRKERGVFARKSIADGKIYILTLWERAIYKR